MGKGRKVLVGGLIGLGCLAALAAVGGGLFVLYVFSIGTAVSSMKIEATALDRATGAPVPNCLLAFEKAEISGWGRSDVRTDAAGRSDHVSSDSQTDSLFLHPFHRERTPWMRLFIGDPPHYGTFDEVESWDVSLKFRVPWSLPATVHPEVRVTRYRRHEEVLDPPPGKQWQQEGTVELPTDPAARLATAEVEVSREPDGHELFRIPLTVYLDRDQIAACQAESLKEVQDRAVEEFNSKRFAAALADYQEATRRLPWDAWGFEGMGDSQAALGRRAEATASYRKAVELEPKDADKLYWLANSLVDGGDAEAVEQFTRLISMEPDKARGLIGLSRAEYNLHHCRESVAALDRAAAICPTCLEAQDRETYGDCGVSRK
jgi:Flp pilus assembly protein TadD